MADGPNGLGLSGQARLERLERMAERQSEMIGDLGNKMDGARYELAEMRRDLGNHDRHHDRWERNHDKHVEDHDRRHRGLDFRWYGVVAGMVAGALYLIYQGGPPSI